MATNEESGIFGAIKKTFTSQAAVKRQSKRDEEPVKQTGTMPGVMPSEPVPNATELDEKFEKFMDRIGVNDKERMRALPQQQKWLLICQAGQSSSQSQLSTSHFLHLLKDSHGAGFTLKEAESLRVTLRYSPVEWLEEFVGLGGLHPFFSIFGTYIEKDTKTSDDLEMITAMVQCCKNLMNTRAGKDGIIESLGAVRAIAEAQKFLSDVNRGFVLELLAALCLWSESAHAVTLRSVESSLDDIVDSMLSLSTPALLRTKLLTFINALVGGMQTAEQQDELRQAMCLDEVAGVMAARHAQIGYFGDENLSTQLDIYSQWSSAEEELQKSTNRDEMTRGFRKLSAHVQQFPHIQPVVIDIMSHLCLLRREGTNGVVGWQIVDAFVRAAAGSPHKDDILALAQSSCENLLEELSDGNVSFKSQIADVQKQLVSIQREKDILSAVLHESRGEGGEGSEGGGGGGASLGAAKEFEKLVQELRAENAELRKKTEMLNSLDNLWFDPAKFHPPPTTQAPPPPQPGAGGGSEGGAPPAPGDADSSGGGGGDGGGGGGGGGGDGPPPPPPPMPGGDGAPPPPPMPGGGPGGPPPPPMMNQGPPPKKKLKPRTKMKGLMWTKVNAKQVKGTVWDEVDDEKLYSQLDRDTLENLFCSAKPKKKGEGEGAGADGEKKKEKEKAVTLLDMRRSQNLSIMLSRFKVSHAEIAKGIERLDPALLSLDNVAALHSFAPTAEEIESVKEFLSAGGKLSELAAPEQFIHAVASIPDLKGRLGSVLTRLSFEQKARAANESVSLLSRAVEEVRSGKRLKKFLEIVLAIGNYLNGSTARGGAFGFKMDSLRKLMDTKSVDNKMTLTHYMADLIEKKHPDLDNLLDDFPSLADATRESLSETRKDIAMLGRDVASVEKALEGYTPLSSADPFQTIMSGFARSASKKVAAMKEMMAQLTANSEKVLEYFAEKKTADIGEFLASLHLSLSLFERAKKENHDRVEAAERARVAEERRKNMPKAKKNTGPRDDGGPEDGKGLLDSILGNMQSGRAFASRRKSSVPRRAGSGEQTFNLRERLRKAPRREARAPDTEPAMPSFLGGLRKARPAEEGQRGNGGGGGGGGGGEGAAGEINFKGMLRKAPPAEREAPPPAEPAIDFTANLRKAPAPARPPPDEAAPTLDFSSVLKKAPERERAPAPSDPEPQADFRSVLKSPRGEGEK